MFRCNDNTLANFFLLDYLRSPICKNEFVALMTENFGSDDVRQKVDWIKSHSAAL